MLQVRSNGRLDWSLLVLRAAGGFLAATFGRQKLLGLRVHFGSGEPLSTWGLTQLIRHFQLPASGLLAITAVLNESLFAASIAAGLLTRAFSFVVACGMVVAFYISTRLGEDPVRALLYVVIFSTVSVLGPGRLSIDHWRERIPGKESEPIRTTLADDWTISAGSLLLRVGVSAGFAIVFWRMSTIEPTFVRSAFVLAVLSALNTLILCGCLTRTASAAAAVLWLIATFYDLRAGNSWMRVPMRDCEFVFAHLPLALLWPGRFSVEHVRQRSTSR